MNNFSDLNHLSVERKTLIINGHVLIDKTKDIMHSPRYNFDLTSKRELKTDIRTIEKYIDLIKKGKTTERGFRELEKSIIRLDTVLNGLINFYGD